MIILYYTVDGQAIVEKSNVNARYIEMRDGYHPVTNDSVWQDDSRRRAPILSMFEGVLGPLGSDMAEKDVKGILLEVEIIKRMHKPQSVSRMWSRMLARIFSWLAVYGMMLLVFLFSAYFVGKEMIGG